MTDVLPSHLLRRGQTPQSLQLSTIPAAYAKAAEDPDFMATDDCTVVPHYLGDVPIAVLPGHDRTDPTWEQTPDPSVVTVIFGYDAMRCTWRLPSL
jgi:hypothetical protein